MSRYLSFSFRFLDAMFHGRGDGGAPEWPPSPLRAFQALAAAAGHRWRKAQVFDTSAREPLMWLERLNPPELIAPAEMPVLAAYRLYVPNNHADIVAAGWASGDCFASIAEHRVEKDVRSTRLTGEIVYYLYPLPADDCSHLDELTALARSITHLGWGVDMVAATASVLSDEEANRLPGERWLPQRGGGTALRVPVAGTLAALDARHAAFLNRLGPEGFRPVPPLTAFATVAYRRDTEAAPRPVAAFQLLKLDASGFRPFDEHRPAVVAGMLRRVTDLAAEAAGWSDELRRGFVHGHGGGPHRQAQGADGLNRFSYLPLPSLERRGGGAAVFTSIRRVLVAEPPGGRGERAAWARRALSGRELLAEPHGTPAALLGLLPESDKALRPYLNRAEAWSTVTPVVLHGHDGGTRRRVERMLRRAIEQAGYPRALAEHAQLEWRGVGYRSGVDLASRYDPPGHLRGRPRYHVWLRWRGAGGEGVSVPGPVALGDGRYCGLGLFAGCDR